MANSRWVRSATSVVVLGIVAGMANAQLRPVGPFGRLSAPTPVAPAGAVAYDIQTPDVTFAWDQHPLFVTPYDALPTHFLFCLSGNPIDVCSHANAAGNHLPGSIPSTLMRTGTRYFLTPEIPEPMLDALHRWSVGACTGNEDSSCAFSSWLTFAPTTVELRAGNISGNVNGEEYIVSAEGQNLGSRPTQELPVIPVARIRGWTVLLDSIAETCRTDPNADDIRNSPGHYVIDHKGQFTRFEDLPRDKAGNYITGNVIAIFAAGDPYSDYVDATFGLSGLAPGPPSQLQGFLAMRVPVAERPAAILTMLGMDDDMQVIEVDETNNRRAECEVVF